MAKLIKKLNALTEEIFSEMTEKQQEITYNFLRSVAQDSSSSEDEDEEETSKKKKSSEDEDEEETSSKKKKKSSEEEEEDEEETSSKKKKKSSEEDEEEDEDETSSKKKKKDPDDDGDEETDYKSMTVKALKSLGEERGINVKKIMKNADDEKKALIKAHKEFDENLEGLLKKSLSKLEKMATKNEVEYAKPRGRATDETKVKAVANALAAAGISA
jgi:cobalamin biosynthesis protein CobT